VIIVYPICILSQTLVNGFATGGSSYISRLLGAKNTEEARHTSVVSFYRTDCIMRLWLVVFLFKETNAFNTSQKQ
jgi:Na+-driven multidrug efflux pump